jgi:hypothetical protein
MVSSSSGAEAFRSGEAASEFGDRSSGPEEKNTDAIPANGRGAGSAPVSVLSVRGGHN